MQIPQIAALGAITFLCETFVTFMSYGPPKDFLIKYHEDSFGDIYLMVECLFVCGWVNKIIIFVFKGFYFFSCFLTTSVFRIFCNFSSF